MSKGTFAGAFSIRFGWRRDRREMGGWLTARTKYYINRKTEWFCIGLCFRLEYEEWPQLRQGHATNFGLLLPWNSKATMTVAGWICLFKSNCSGKKNTGILIFVRIVDGLEGSNRTNLSTAMGWNICLHIRRSHKKENYSCCHFKLRSQILLNL